MPTTTPPPTTARRPPGGRDPLVDGLRSVALVRVVLWHAVAAPWLSWIFPAMPVMFFLAGSVLAGSVLAGAGQASGRRLIRRVGRILIPFWAYSVAVAAIVLLTGASTGGWRQLLSFAVPLHDTSGTDRDWLTGHLWYLTDYLVLLVLLPVAMVAARRIRPVVAAALLGLLALELGPALGLPAVTGAARIAAGDLLCYGLFAVLGIAWAVRRPGPPSARTAAGRAAAGTTLIVATLAAGSVVPLPSGSLNESYLLLATAALGWLLLLGAAERPLRRALAGPRMAAVSRAVSARALTIYLWHPVAILLALDLAAANGVEGPATALPVLLLTGMLTAAAVVAFGWVEDLAARRPPRWWPGRTRPTVRISVVRRGAVAAGVVAVTAVGVAGALDQPGGGATAAMPRPSDRTALSDTAFLPADHRPTTGGIADADAAEFPGADLQAALEHWIAAQPEVDDAVASVAAGPRTWSGSTIRADGEPPAAESSIGMASLTKTFTAALAVQFAVDGLLELDAPVPDLPGVAPIPDGPAVTPRQLLQHSTGLVQYTDAPGYDAALTYTAAELVSLSTRAPLAHPPDTGVTYSNSNYLWLGLLLESIAGTGYPDLVSDRIAGPLGLPTVAVIADDRTGWVGSASGGISARPADVARFFDALLNRGEVLSVDGVQRMTDLNHLNGGLGVWPMCPCGESADGRKWATGLGHHVGDGATIAFPDDRLAVYVRITGRDIGAERMTEMRDQLVLLMRDTARPVATGH